MASGPKFWTPVTTGHSAITRSDAVRQRSGIIPSRRWRPRACRKPSLVPERVDRIESRSLTRRIEPEKHSDRAAHGKSDQDRTHVDNGVEVCEDAHQPR